MKEFSIPLKEKIRRIARQYMRLFHQESVLITQGTVRAYFVKESLN